MSDDIDQTKAKPPEFDFSAFPSDSVFHDRRTGIDRRDEMSPPVKAPRHEKTAGERRAKKERRKRIDPTTFEKQYTEEELEFMTAIQKFKERSGKPFPNYREVLKVAASIGYRRVMMIDDDYSMSFASVMEGAEESDRGLDADILVPSQLPKTHLV